MIGESRGGKATVATASIPVARSRSSIAGERPSRERSAQGDRSGRRRRERNPDRPWYRYAYRLFPPSETGPWLDLGCGQGELLEAAERRGLHGFGLDVSIDNAAAARRAGRPALVADLNRALPLASGALAGACLIEVIEHIVRAEDLLEELARVIRPGGWLVLTTPNVVHWTYRWRALTGHPPKQEGYHYRFFTKKLLARRLSDAGFALRDRASFGKQALLTTTLRWVRGRGYKFRYQIPAPAEALLAQHFVWRLERLSR